MASPRISLPSQASTGVVTCAMTTLLERLRSPLKRRSAQVVMRALSFVAVYSAASSPADEVAATSDLETRSIVGDSFATDSRNGGDGGEDDARPTTVESRPEKAVVVPADASASSTSGETEPQVWLAQLLDDVTDDKIGTDSTSGVEPNPGAPTGGGTSVHWAQASALAGWRNAVSAQPAERNLWTPLEVIGDSNMIITQMRNRRRPKAARLRCLYETARSAADALRIRHWHHHYRSHNKMADKAANQAMDSTASYQTTATHGRPELEELRPWLLNDYQCWAAPPDAAPPEPRPGQQTIPGVAPTSRWTRRAGMPTQRSTETCL
ncbi:hypothetical protein P43SY_009957 [Pythium insidiosum]|uniref:RNase H type-1 domain-containing protein n=1 Tax=Pythium insidiosum TaxID=114742 RepID=A0AAD5LI57_PYTIN|nr:hypothetical protein P43SY_009957 [Pythium insidiosum]